LRLGAARDSGQDGCRRGQLQKLAACRLHRCCPAYSALTFAIFISGVQRAISLVTKAASACGPRFDLAGISQPRSARRLRTFSSSSALSSVSASLSTTAFGVPLGANKAFQADASNPGRPASLAVATLGMAGFRSAVLMA